MNKSMKLVKEFPKLFCVSSKNELQEWQASVFANPDDTAVLRRTYGFVGKKIQSKDKNVKAGKNIGKKNETTPVEQALSMAQSEMNGKIKANHEYEPMDVKTYVPRVILPQLASKKGKIIFPCDQQPKLNGVCDIVHRYHAHDVFKNYFPAYPEYKGLKAPEGSEPTEGLVHHSRGGLTFSTLEHLNPWLIKMMKLQDMWHGELYIHGLSLQQIRKYVVKLRDDAERLELWIYDNAVLNSPWLDRWEILKQQFIEDENCPVRICPTFKVNSMEEAIDLNATFVGDGFEGSILRNHKDLYVFEHRNKGVEKMKKYDTKEYEIIGGKEGSGTDEGCVIFRCITEEGKEFNVRPCGSVADRKKMFKNLPHITGKMLSVRYFEFSDDGIPQQPTGKPGGEVIRDYE